MIPENKLSTFPKSIGIIIRYLAQYDNYKCKDKAFPNVFDLGWANFFCVCLNGFPSGTSTPETPLSWHGYVPPSIWDLKCGSHKCILIIFTTWTFKPLWYMTCIIQPLILQGTLQLSAGSPHNAWTNYLEEWQSCCGAQSQRQHSGPLLDTCSHRRAIVKTPSG